MEDSSKQTDVVNAANLVLGGLYSCLHDHSQYEQLFMAFDKFIENSDEDNISYSEWKVLFKEHFQKANEIFESAFGNTESPSRYLARQPLPAMVLDQSYKVVSVNELFETRFGGQISDLIELLKLDKQWSLLPDVLSGEQEWPVLFQVEDEGKPSEVIIATHVTLLDPHSERACNYIALRLAKPVWASELSTLLNEVYELTASEIEIVQTLFEQADIARIAAVRKRSIRTVRTQLASIYTKMGVSGQIHLVLLVMSLLQLSSLDKAESSFKLSHPQGFPTSQVRTRTGRLSYIEYGAKQGEPVLVIQSSYPPEMSADFRKACYEANLRMITPLKPGTGSTTSRPGEDGPEQLAEDYDALMKALDLDRISVAGFASGGMYALGFAKLFPHRVKKVILSDTGVPFQTYKELLKLPKNCRRTLLAARYMPDILLAPHKIIASNFFRSETGEAKIIDFFFAEHPADSSLTQSSATYYQITRRMISYSFDNIQRLVADVCRWASDWSALLDAVAKTHDIVFVHGAENKMFKADPIQTYCSDKPNVKLVEVPEEGQLQAFRRPDLFVEAFQSPRTGSD